MYIFVIIRRSVIYYVSRLPPLDASKSVTFSASYSLFRSGKISNVHLILQKFSITRVNKSRYVRNFVVILGLSVFTRVFRSIRGDYGFSTQGGFLRFWCSPGSLSVDSLVSGCL